MPSLLFRGRVVALATAAGLAVATPASADETADFEHARTAYLHALSQKPPDYGPAEQQFKTILGTLKTKELVELAEFYLGATEFGMRKEREAHEVWDKLILATASQFQPDETVFPRDVLDEWITEKEKMNDAVRRQNEQHQREEEARRQQTATERAKLIARVKTLEELAATETVVVVNSRAVALLPFGVGQFQNRQSALGWTFLLVEGAAVLATAVLFVPYRYNIDQYNATLASGNGQYSHLLADEYAANAQNFRTADLIIVGGLGAVAIAGILQAEVAFQPSFTSTRARKVTSLTPTVSVLREGGAAVGLQGTF